MYSTKSVEGFPAIQRNGKNVLSVWNRDWEFAYELCELLNQLEGAEPELQLNEDDRRWLKALDRAFTRKVKKVQHA